MKESRETDKHVERTKACGENEGMLASEQRTERREAAFDVLILRQDRRNGGRGGRGPRGLKNNSPWQWSIKEVGRERQRDRVATITFD